MADAVYELDPSADTIIVLKNPGAPFAVWEPDAATKTPESGKVALWIEEHWNLNEAVSPAPSIKKKKGKWWQGPVYDWPAVPEPAPAPEPEPPLEDQFAPVDDASRDEVMDFANDDDQSTIRDINLGSSLFGGEHPQSAEANSFVVRAETEAPSKSGFDEPNMLVDDGTGEQGEGNVYYYVSSRHLALASGFFKSALAKDGWLEGHPSAEDGKYHLSTADWDPEAFLILLRIFHPRRTSFVDAGNVGPDSGVGRLLPLQRSGRDILRDMDQRCEVRMSSPGHLWKGSCAVDVHRMGVQAPRRIRANNEGCDHAERDTNSSEYGSPYSRCGDW
jgi:hypothetical protein